MASFHKFDTKNKTMTEISKTVGSDPQAGVLRYQNNGKFISFKYNQLINGAPDWGLYSTQDFLSWPKFFEKTSVYGTGSYISYFRADDIATSKKGDIHMVGKTSIGNPGVQNLQVWSYICN